MSEFLYFKSIKVMEEAFSLLNQAFEEVNEAWVWGSLAKVDKEKMRALEEAIGEAVLSGDLEKLKVLISSWKDLMMGAVKEFRTEVAEIKKELQEVLPLVS